MITLLGRSVLAVMFTTGAFLLMSYLIAPGEIPPEPNGQETKISITREKRVEDSIRQNQELPTPPMVQNSPPPMMAMATPQASLTSVNLKIINPGKNNLNPVNSSATGNRRAIPMVTIPPEYPQNLLARGIEGWVLLGFTIGIDGSVEDIVVIDAEPKGAFDRAAIRAMKRWKYQPKLVDGRPVAQYHMREVFRFEIEK